MLSFDANCGEPSVMNPGNRLITNHLNIADV